MNILVLGGTGMLGHKMFQVLQERAPDVWCTVRGSSDEAAALAPGLFSGANLIPHIDANDLPALERMLAERRPRVIVNCVGIIKQRLEARAAIPSITINALLPHMLARWCERRNGRLIHFSTDCVFSGQRGNYSEDDVADACDLYGRTKYLGEVSGRTALTLRTSIIGRELEHFQSLVEWFLRQNGGRVRGYTRALYSGVTTNYLAGLVGRIIEEHCPLHGLYQVTAATISKFEILCLLRDVYRKDVEIVPDDTFFCDRSMQGNKVIAATGYRTPPWPELMAQLADDRTPYEQWRRNVQQTI